jgi:hypothetical protein
MSARRECTGACHRKMHFLGYKLADKECYIILFKKLTLQLRVGIYDIELKN